MFQEAPVTEVQVRPFPETVVGTIGVLLSWLTIHARMSRFAPGAIEFVVADVIFEPAAPPSVRSVALMAARDADGTTNNRRARLAARRVLMNVSFLISSALIFRVPQARNSHERSFPFPNFRTIPQHTRDRKSTRLNSSHTVIS